LPVRERNMTRPTITPSELGALVRGARKAQGLRQDELAGVAGVGLRFIVELEGGKPTVQLGKVLRVLETLGCGLTITTPSEQEPGGKP